MTGRLRTAALVAMVAGIAAACTGASRATFPPLGSTPGPAGDATVATTQQIVRALADVGLQAAVTARPFRPSEGPLLAAAPRSVIQVALPDDPEHGFVVVYALADPTIAIAAATDTAAYVATSTGRIQFVAGSRFTLRVVGATVIFFSWSPDNAPDARTHLIEDALSTLGDSVAIPA